MTYRRLHPWRVSLARAARLQESLRRRLRLRPSPRLRTLRAVAGADVSFERGGEEIFGAVVVLSWPGLAVLEVAGASGRASFPYVPGYLSFREIPVLLRAFAKIRSRPGVVFCDGQGIAHPRRFGLASHLGLLLGVPSIGCAKSRLVGEHEEPAAARGSQAPLLLDGRRVGTVLRTRDGVAPIFVSPGHGIDQAAAAQLVLQACRRFRIPEPTRAAHREVNRLRRAHAAGRPPAPERAADPGGAEDRRWSGT